MNILNMQFINLELHIHEQHELLSQKQAKVNAKRTVMSDHESFAIVSKTLHFMVVTAWRMFSCSSWKSTWAFLEFSLWLTDPGESAETLLIKTIARPYRRGRIKPSHGVHNRVLVWITESFGLPVVGWVSTWIRCQDTLESRSESMSLYIAESTNKDGSTSTFALPPQNAHLKKHGKKVVG